jgi:hypothetical protein
MGGPSEHNNWTPLSGCQTSVYLYLVEDREVPGTDKYQVSGAVRCGYVGTR